MSRKNPRSPESEPSFAPRYDLGEVSVAQLTEDLLHDRPPKTSNQLVCYRIETDDEMSNVARTVERTVFEKYFPGNDAKTMQQEYGPYEQTSTFFLSIDRENKKPAGTLRVISNGSNGLKTINDYSESISADAAAQYHSIESLDNVWDVGTVAVLPDYRGEAGFSASIQVYRAMYASAMEETGIEHLVSAIDERALHKMTKYLKIPFVPLAGLEAGPYLDSESTQPVYGNLAEFYPKMHRQLFTIGGFVARRALGPLVTGSRDETLML